MKRPDKIKFTLSKPPASMRFSDSAYTTRSTYADKLNEALGSDSCVVIAKGDAYLMLMMRNAAKKLGLKLVYAVQDGSVWIKPIAPTEDQKRLTLYLREPRSMNDLVGYKLQLDLKTTLAKMKVDGLVHVIPAKNTFPERWSLTEKGMDLL